MIFVIYFKYINIKKMKKINKKGFTLIELLVVITIIGILATWAVSVYTSQIQKARDSTRITSLTAIKAWVEQFYQDDGQYPEPLTFSWVTLYTPNLPKDPKSGQSGKSSFEYAYAVWPDSNTIIWQDYELSVTFENSWNLTKKAAVDGWANPNRYEIGIDLGWNNTRINWPQTMNSWVGTGIPVWSVCIAASANETATTNQNSATACTVSNWTSQSSILVIR